MANFTGANLQIETVQPKAKVPAISVPYVQTASGELIAQEAAIAGYLARLNPDAGLLGSSLLQEATINEWVNWAISTQALVGSVVSVIQGNSKTTDFKKWN